MGAPEENVKKSGTFLSVCGYWKNVQNTGKIHRYNQSLILTIISKIAPYKKKGKKVGLFWSFVNS